MTRNIPSKKELSKLSHIPTLEERIALVESVVLPHLEGTVPCRAPVYAQCECDAEAVGTEVRANLDADIDDTIITALDSLREVLRDGANDEVLAATDQILAYLVTDATE